MSSKHLNILTSICLAFFFLAACTRPISKAPTAIPSIAYTQAVQTVVAKLTSTPSGQIQPTALATLAQASTATVKPVNTPIPPTDTPVPLATVTTVASPASTFDPSDPLAGLGNPDWHEGFESTGTWFAFQDEFMLFQSVENKLEMTAFQANNRNGWALAPQLVSTKFYVEMTATFGNACKGKDHFGLMISPVSSADKGYLLGVSCEGKYVFWKWDGQSMTALVKWTPSKDIQAGANKTNRIGLMVNGKKLSLFVNGVLLTELNDKTYEKVYFGVFVGASETANFLVRVSSLNYWSLP
jgi:hypothetical protein